MTFLLKFKILKLKKRTPQLQIQIKPIPSIINIIAQVLILIKRASHNKDLLILSSKVAIAQTAKATIKTQITTGALINIQIKLSICRCIESTI